MIITGTALCQPGKFVFTNYTMANGLPDNNIQSVIQDSRGYIWLGTREGLSRFDGNTFRNFFAEKDKPNSLPGNSVSHLYEYQENRLLFLADGALNTLNTLTRQFGSPAFSSGYVYYKITTDGKGKYGLSRPDTAFIINHKLELTDTLVPPVRQKGYVVDIYWLNEQYLLTGTQREYFLYDRKRKEYQLLLDGTQTGARQPNFVFQYYDPTDHIFYFSNFYAGLFSYNEQGKPLYNWKQDNSRSGLTNSNISFMRKMNDSIFWLGTIGGGLHILNSKSRLIEKFTHNKDEPGSIAGNNVVGCYHSRDNNEWLATTQGASKLNNAVNIIQSWKKEFAPIVREESNNLLNITKGVNGLIYTGTYGMNTAFSINPATQEVRRLTSPQLPYLWSMNSIDNKIVFTGSGTRICTYDPLTGQYAVSDFLKPYFPTAELVILAFKSARGDSWYSGNNGGGFVRVEAGTGKIYHYTSNGPRGTFSISYYTSFAETRNGDIWFGVNKSGKLLRWSRESDQFSEKSLTNLEGAKSTFFTGISDLRTDAQDRIWIAFDGSGLVCFDWKNNKVRQFTIEKGLPSNYLYFLQFDHRNRLWIGTTKGLSCYQEDKNKFISFTREDGLPDDFFYERCTFFDNSNHKLWIGSRNTVMCFDTDSLLAIYRKEIPVYIDDIIVNGKPFYSDADKPWGFNPMENNIQFHFGGVDINNGKDLEYNYQLSGADPDWIENNTATTASYANLAPGRYHFLVRARHRGETEWSTLSTPFYFTIATPWNKTWWFRGLLLSGLAFLTTWIIRDFYKRKLEREKAILENEQAIERERTRMARELHDGLGSMLSGIKHSFNALQNQLNLDQTQQTSFDANIYKLNESIRELRNITHRMASDSMLKYGLENSLKDYCKNMSQPGGLTIIFTSVGTAGLALKEDKAFHLFRIVQELLQNIIKHASATEALVQLSLTGDQLHITVEDNGTGFNPSDKDDHPGIGLKNIAARISLLKGKSDFQSSPERGTSVMIEVPVNG